MEAIRNITIRQADVLLRFHTDNTKQEWMGLLGLHRMAFHADAKGIKDYIKQLEVDE